MAAARWQLIVPRPEQHVPPAPIGYLGSCGFARDALGLAYVRAPRYHAFGETWRPEGDGWVQVSQAVSRETAQPWTVLARPEARGLRCWSVVRSGDHRSPLVPGAFDVRDGEVVEVDLGAAPELHRPGRFSQATALFADDPGNGRTLVLDSRALHAFADDGAGWVQLASVEGLPDQWHQEEMATAAVDPVSGALFVALVDTADYEGHLYRFDGRRFDTIAGPAGISLASENTLASLVQDGEALWLVVGEPHAARYRWSGQGWEPSPERGLPRSSRVSGAFDAQGRLWLGPGFYEPVTGRFATERKVFHVLDGVRVERSGHWITHSPTEWSSGVCLAARDGVLWVASKRYPLGLRRVDARGWEELVGESGGLGFEGSVEAALLHDGALHVVGSHGEVARFESGEWQSVSPAHPDWADRIEPCVVSTPDGLVAWGGEIKNRKSNHTFRHDGTGWIRIKKASPTPSDFRHKHGPYVKWNLVWDRAQRAVLRMGHDDVSILVGDLWEAFVPDGWAEVTQHNAPLAVPDEATGEILLYDLCSNALFRFGFDRIAPLGAVAFDPTSIDPDEQGTFAHVGAFVRAGLMAVDPARRGLIGQGAADAAEGYVLPLAEAFEAAAALGPRAPYGGAPVPVVVEAPVEGETVVRLYNVTQGSKFWFADVEGAAVRVRSGGIEDWQVRLARGTAVDGSKDAASPAAAAASVGKQAAAKRKQGYVGAGDLSDDALSELFISPVHAWRLVETEPQVWDPGHLGGVPCGVSAAAWPKDAHGAPLGHLITLGLPFEGKQVSAVSVFVPPAGAMEDGEAVVLPRTTKQLSKPREAPAGAPTLPMQSLTIHNLEDLELTERSWPFEVADAVLAARLEDLVARQGSGVTHWTRWGGKPTWVQGEEVPHDEEGRPWRFVGQVDFGSFAAAAAVREHWPESGLFGTLYVFLSADEKQATALWQYT